MKKNVYQICVSGAAGGVMTGSALMLAGKVAREIVGHNHVLLTGATKGLPYAAAKAAKSAGGMSIGFSPAASRVAHIKKYQLPVDAYDTVLYTGFEYTGRNLLLVRSCDALIMVGGRIGTLNELTIGIEELKPVGVLMGGHGMSDEVDRILKVAKRARTNIIFDEDPARLVERLEEILDGRYSKLEKASE